MEKQVIACIKRFLLSPHNNMTECIFSRLKQNIWQNIYMYTYDLSHSLYLFNKITPK